MDFRNVSYNFGKIRDSFLMRSYIKEQSITEDNSITDGHTRMRMARELAIDDTLYV